MDFWKISGRIRELTKMLSRDSLLIHGICINPNSAVIGSRKKVLYIFDTHFTLNT